MNDFSKLPQRLKEHPEWCLWRYEKDKNGRDTKVPYSIKDQRAKPDKPETFSGFNACLVMLNMAARRYNGLGLRVSHGLACVDLDDCILEDGSLTSVAAEVFRILNSRTELSPSGRGLHIWIIVEEGFQYDRENYKIVNRVEGQKLEVYVSGATNHFMTVTGELYKGSPTSTVEPRQKELLQVLDKFMEMYPAELPAAGQIFPNPGLSDSEVLRIMDHARNREKTSKLRRGEWEGDYESQSDADGAMVTHFLFYTGTDEAGLEQTDRLFRGTALMRSKWDRRLKPGYTYGSWTIKTAAAKLPNVYKPRATVFPSDRTDVGQAKVFSDLYKEELCFSKATGWMRYKGGKWSENDLDAQILSQELTDMQMEEAKKDLDKATLAMEEAAENDDEDSLKEAKTKQSAANKALKYAMGRRKAGAIQSCLAMAESMLQIDPGRQLDRDPYLLNTPAGSVDLHSGEMREHRPEDYCTKMTAVAPDQKNRDLFLDFLARITNGDQELAEYLHQVAGMILVGEVKQENLIIATGEGGCGKSTYFNLLYKVLGDYALRITADNLTIGTKNSTKGPEIVQMRGKRFVLSGELEEGQRLSVATMKQICSTDSITARALYKMSVTFDPQHTLCLYTNYLPKVGSIDSGTWDRVVVIPFTNRIRGTADDIKNYADILFHSAGGAVLSWMIEGAVQYIRSEYKLALPECVKEATKEYRQEYNWVENFTHDYCEVDPSYRENVDELYQEYSNWCCQTGEYKRNRTDFKTGMIRAGFIWHRVTRGYHCIGLKLAEKKALTSNTVPDVSEFDDDEKK